MEKLTSLFLKAVLISFLLHIPHSRAIVSTKDIDAAIKESRSFWNTSQYAEAFRKAAEIAKKTRSGQVTMTSKQRDEFGKFVATLLVWAETPAGQSQMSREMWEIFGILSQGHIPTMHQIPGMQPSYSFGGPQTIPGAVTSRWTAGSYGFGGPPTLHGERTLFTQQLLESAGVKASSGYGFGGPSPLQTLQRLPSFKEREKKRKKEKEKARTKKILGGMAKKIKFRLREATRMLSDDLEENEAAAMENFKMALQELNSGVKMEMKHTIPGACFDSEIANILISLNLARIASWEKHWGEKWWEATGKTELVETCLALIDASKFFLEEDSVDVRMRFAELSNNDAYKFSASLETAVEHAMRVVGEVRISIGKILRWIVAKKNLPDAMEGLEDVFVQHKVKKFEDRQLHMVKQICLAPTPWKESPQVANLLFTHPEIFSAMSSKEKEMFRKRYTSPMGTSRRHVFQTFWENYKRLFPLFKNRSTHEHGLWMHLWISAQGSVKEIPKRGAIKTIRWSDDEWRRTYEIRVNGLHSLAILIANLAYKLGDQPGMHDTVHSFLMQAAVKQFYLFASDYIKTLETMGPESEHGSHYRANFSKLLNLINFKTEKKFNEDEEKKKKKKKKPESKTPGTPTTEIYEQKVENVPSTEAKEALSHGMVIFRGKLVAYKPDTEGKEYKKVKQLTKDIRGKKEVSITRWFERWTWLEDWKFFEERFGKGLQKKERYKFKFTPLVPELKFRWEELEIPEEKGEPVKTTPASAPLESALAFGSWPDSQDRKMFPETDAFSQSLRGPELVQVDHAGQTKTITLTTPYCVKQPQGFNQLEAGPCGSYALYHAEQLRLNAQITSGNWSTFTSQMGEFPLGKLEGSTHAGELSKYVVDTVRKPGSGMNSFAKDVVVFENMQQALTSHQDAYIEQNLLSPQEPAFKRALQAIKDFRTNATPVVAIIHNEKGHWFAAKFELKKDNSSGTDTAWVDVTAINSFGAGGAAGDLRKAIPISLAVYFLADFPLTSNETVDVTKAQTTEKVCGLAKPLPLTENYSVTSRIGRAALSLLIPNLTPKQIIDRQVSTQLDFKKPFNWFLSTDQTLNFGSSPSERISIDPNGVITTNPLSLKNLFSEQELNNYTKLKDKFLTAIEDFSVSTEKGRNNTINNFLGFQKIPYKTYDNLEVFLDWYISNSEFRIRGSDGIIIIENYQEVKSETLIIFIRLDKKQLVTKLKQNLEKNIFDEEWVNKITKFLKKEATKKK
ncbi:hypothetical protein ACFLY6_02280 [Candidatus Dependentiae bacterium]